jgi:disulfide bond formation protein DsbB
MSIQAAKEQGALTLRTNAAVALFVGGMSAALLLGALAFQYLGGLAPCEMCVWQRWPHGVATALGLGGGLLVMTRALPEKAARPLAVLAIAAIAISGFIGIFHAGVEWKLWPGPSACTGFGYVPGADDFNTLKVIRCDEAQWRLFGISLAGYNAVFSLGVAALGLSLLNRAKS